MVVEAEEEEDEEALFVLQIVVQIMETDTRNGAKYLDSTSSTCARKNALMLQQGSAIMLFPVYFNFNFYLFIHILLVVLNIPLKQAMYILYYFIIFIIYSLFQSSVVK